MLPSPLSSSHRGLHSPLGGLHSPLGGLPSPLGGLSPLGGQDPQGAQYYTPGEESFLSGEAYHPAPPQEADAGPVPVPYSVPPSYDPAWAGGRSTPTLGMPFGSSVHAGEPTSEPQTPLGTHPPQLDLEALAQYERKVAAAAAGSRPPASPAASMDAKPLSAKPSSPD